MSKTEQSDLTTVVEEPEQTQDENKSVEKEPDSDSGEETLVDDDDVPEDVPEVSVSPVKKVKRKYTRRAPKETIPTSDENVTVILKTRKRGPKKKQVIVYKEDLPQDPIEIVEKIRRKPGRPRTKPVEVVKEVGQPEVIVFEKLPNKKSQRNS